MISANNCSGFSAKFFNGTLISRIAIALLFFVVGPVSANAQVQNGIFTGTITDPQGAAAACAALAITNAGATDTLNLKTNTKGVYRFPAVLPATYTLHSPPPGFRKKGIG